MKRQHVFLLKKKKAKRHQVPNAQMRFGPDLRQDFIETDLFGAEGQNNCHKL